MNPLDDPKVKQQVQVLGYTRILGYCLALLGLCILAWNAGWWVAGGILLLVLGNNAASGAALGLALMKLTGILVETFEMVPKQYDCVRDAGELIRQARSELDARR